MNPSLKVALSAPEISKKPVVALVVLFCH